MTRHNNNNGAKRMSTTENGGEEDDDDSDDERQKFDGVANLELAINTDLLRFFVVAARAIGTPKNKMIASCLQQGSTLF
jgi:hypothetical protein